MPGLHMAMLLFLLQTCLTLWLGYGRVFTVIPLPKGEIFTELYFIPGWQCNFVPSEMLYSRRESF